MDRENRVLRNRSPKDFDEEHQFSKKSSPPKNTSLFLGLPFTLALTLQPRLLSLLCYIVHVSHAEMMAVKSKEECNRLPLNFTNKCKNAWLSILKPQKTPRPVAISNVACLEARNFQGSPFQV